MMDYTIPPPREFVEGMFPLNSPDPRSMRIIEETIDVGEYLPHDQLITELQSTNSCSWHGLGPTETFLHWLEKREEMREYYSHFGEGIPKDFCASRRAY